MGLKAQGVTRVYSSGLVSGTTYVSLHTANPTSGNELSGNAYARVARAANSWTITTTDGTARNTAAFSFPTPTGTWGDPTHWALNTAASGGSIIISGALTDDVRAPAANDTVRFAARAMVFDLAVDGE